MTSLGRTLFVFPYLPRPAVSIAGAIAGDEALSGTHVSGVLAAEGLARRGHQIAAVSMDGRDLTDASFITMHSVTEAARWVGSGHIVWVYHGDDTILDRLNSEGLVPSVWAEVHVSDQHLQWLKSGRIRDLLTVSDTARLPLLRSPLHARIGRVHNPLAPAFEVSSGTSAPSSPDRFTCKRVVFSGSPTRNKGFHRLLAMWSHVREADPSAVLQLAGTGKLYGDTRPLGPHGITSPEYESRHIEPLVARFGSLDAAGIEPCGLLSPNELRRLYERSSIGIVNLNWRDYTETFCCAAVEMLATGLPVFSVARGALPEVIGASGGAYLSQEESPQAEAAQLLDMLRGCDRLSKMGTAGAEYVRREYGWPRITQQWERVLSTSSNVETVTGEWRGPHNLRYWIERGTGRIGVGWILDWAPKHSYTAAAD